MLPNKEQRLRTLGLYSGPNPGIPSQAFKLPTQRGNGGGSGGWRLRPDLVYARGKPATMRFGSSRQGTGTRKRFFF